MFHGSIPASVQQILCTIVKEWEVPEIYVGCSGNFTIERTLQGAVPARLHGNDVTVYSCLLGRYFSGQPLAVEYNDDYSGPMEFIRGYLEDSPSIVAVVLLLSKMATYLGSRPNPYYLKMIEAYSRQWEALFTATREKIERITPFLASFYAGDVCGWIDTIPEQAGFICYPPFFTGDYEKMFRVIEQLIRWDAPQYEMINKERIFELFRKMVQRPYFMFGTNDELPEFREYLVGISQTTNRGVPLYLYARSRKSHIVMPVQNVSSPLLPRLGPQEDIGETIQIVTLKSEQFHALRSQYMNVNIKPGSESAAYGVAVDGKLIGIYAFSSSPTLANWDKYIDTPTMYLLSDFPVAPSKYKRLAKLVLYAALSKESKLLAERISNKRIRSLVTTAFSKRPVSMKYRGLFRELNKKRLPGVDEEETDMSKRYYNEGYQINYGALMGEWSLAEGLQLWKEKHGQAEGRNEK
ncbi:MAG: hypothetical protein HFG27_08495 [Provencibacterium sp.]|jgi:hypothetical protein|nr:hypothetical protein [Provencibacterium sp.]